MILPPEYLGRHKVYTIKSPTGRPKRPKKAVKNKIAKQSRKRNRR